MGERFSGPMMRKDERRKYARVQADGKGRAKQTVSPTFSRLELTVERRSVAVYAALAEGGGQ